jgi:DNA-binding CsgD family transcriptional regulator
MHTRELTIGQHTLSLETGKLAKQAGGAVRVRFGDSVVLVTACRAASPREGIDFLPLTVDYREYTYASGRIPGGFFKREGKPAEKEVLTSRCIDRPTRPLFAEGWRFETQIIALVLSADQENDTDVLAITGASVALALSDIPFQKTIAAVRMGLDELRRAARRARYERLFGLFRTPPPTPEDVRATRDDRDRVRSVLAAIRPREASLLLLRAEGQSYEEVAAAAGLKSSSVGTLISRAQCAFRLEYERRYGPHKPQ